MTKHRFRIEQIASQFPLIWATTEWFYWDQQLNEILKADVDDTLFGGAYDAVDWESYYERLKDTPFYDWAVEGGGILSFGGPAHIENDNFFSTIGELSTFEGDWLREHPEFNQVLHDIHVETAEQMIAHLLQHGPRKRRVRHRRTSTVDFAIPRACLYRRFSGHPGPCPRCGGTLQQSTQTYLAATGRGERITDTYIISNDMGWYCANCPTVVIDLNAVNLAFAHLMPGWEFGDEFAVLGTLDLDVIPPEQAHLPIDEVDPLPLVPFDVVAGRAAPPRPARPAQKKRRKRTKPKRSGRRKKKRR